MTVTNPNEAQEYLSPDEAAALLPATSGQTVLRWAKQGLIPFIELPGTGRSRKFFRRSDIEALLTPQVASSPSASSAESADSASGHGSAQFPGQEVLTW